ncbi:Uncharacterised protein [[Clostridium] sordellii]|nr:Uncharacterised protein [[Clostridium] sordellii] [Paeniclostridium sordellii]
MDKKDRELLNKKFQRVTEYNIRLEDLKLEKHKVKSKFIKGIATDKGIYRIYEIKCNKRSIFCIVDYNVGIIQGYKRNIRDALNYIKIFEIMSGLLDENLKEGYIKLPNYKEFLME